MSELIQADYNPLPNEEVNQIIRKIQNGDKSKIKKLIESYHRLLCQYACQFSRDSYLFEDAYQDACLGMIHAIDLFDTDNNCSFATFSFFHIQNYCRVGYLRQYKISIPKCSTYYRLLTSCHNDTHVSKKTHDYMRNLNVLSLEDLTINNDSEKKVELKDSWQSQREFEKKEMVNMINSLVKELNLPENSQKIFNSIFGINNEEKKTMREIAKENGLSHQAIKQFKDRCLVKLRIICRKYNITPELFEEYI